MGLMSTFDIASSGLAVQKQRMDVTAENLANISSTRTPEGGPYQKKSVVISSVPLMGFEKSLSTFLGGQAVNEGADVVSVVKSNNPPRIVFDPSHPDADANGNLALPDISSMEEMIDMMSASKAYEANVTAFNSAKSMMLRTLDIGGN